MLYTLRVFHCTKSRYNPFINFLSLNLKMKLPT